VKLLAVERPPKVEVHCPHQHVRPLPPFRTLFTPLTLQDTSVKVAPESLPVRVLPWPPDDPEGNVLVGRSGGEDDELRVGIVGDALDVVCGSLGLVAAYGQAIRLRVTTVYRRRWTILEEGKSHLHEIRIEYVELVSLNDLRRGVVHTEPCSAHKTSTGTGPT
jgi:hypothetical protein